MKIARRKTGKKKLIITGLLAAIILAAGTGAYFLYRTPATVASKTPQPAPTNTVNYRPATPQEQQDGSDTKKATIESSSNSQAPSLSMVISRAGQVDANSAVSIRTIIDGATSGSCDAVFTMPGKAAITKTFAITQGPTSTTCNGDIPLSEFSASGDWKLMMTAKSGNSVVAAPTMTVTVKK